MLCKLLKTLAHTISVNTDSIHFRTTSHYLFELEIYIPTSFRHNEIRELMLNLLPKKHPRLSMVNLYEKLSLEILRPHSAIAPPFAP